MIVAVIASRRSWTFKPYGALRVRHMASLTSSGGLLISGRGGNVSQIGSHSRIFLSTVAVTFPPPPFLVVVNVSPSHPLGAREASSSSTMGL